MAPESIEPASHTAASFPGFDNRFSLFLGATQEGRWFESGADINNVRVGSVSEDTPATFVSLRLSWRSGSKNLIAEYYEDGPAGGHQWKELVQRDISKATFDWKMTAESSFQIAVFGNSQQIAVRSGDEAFKDNFTAPPVLTTAQVNGSVTVKWPVEAAGFILESSELGSPAPAWGRVLDPSVLINGQNTVTVNASTRALFYRLRK